MKPDNLFRWLAAYQALARPIPKYPNGSDHSDKGPAMIGESGPEIAHVSICMSNLGAQNAGRRIEVRRNNHRDQVIKFGEVNENGDVIMNGAFTKALGLGDIKHLRHAEAAVKEAKSNDLTDSIELFCRAIGSHENKANMIRDMERLLNQTTPQQIVFNRVRAKYANRWKMKDA